MLGSKIRVFGPKFGTSGCVVQPAWIVPIVYDALATAEFVRPDLIPIALTVRVDGTLIGPLYSVEDAVGVDPSTVYRIVEPAVEVEIVTVCAVV
jgi:hypothetical protein